MKASQKRAKVRTRQVMKKMLVLGSRKVEAGHSPHIDIQYSESDFEEISDRELFCDTNERSQEEYLQFLQVQTKNHCLCDIKLLVIMGDLFFFWPVDDC